MNEDLAIDIMKIIKKGETFGPSNVYNELRVQEGYLVLTDEEFKETVKLQLNSDTK